MNLSQLQISGDLNNDPKTLEKFSKDVSSYRIMPALVAEPKYEGDILNIVQFVKNEGLSITSRAGGSGLSGTGVGTGIILNFKKYFNQVLSVGEETVVQPGTILDDFLKQMQKLNLMLPSVTPSSVLCALGGNVGTRSPGPRTARYGTIDDFVTSLKFITARDEIVDTRNPLPKYLDNGLQNIRNQFLRDKKSQEIVARRPFIAGGYNLKALVRYSDTRELTAHLMVSSVGTLGIVTEIRLKLMENKPSLWKYAWENKKLLPSIIDDVAIHLKNFGAVRREIAELMKKLDLEISFFGHLGFGSVHSRPYFDPGKGDLIEQIMTVSQETFKILQK